MPFKKRYGLTKSETKPNKDSFDITDLVEKLQDVDEVLGLLEHPMRFIPTLPEPNTYRYKPFDKEYTPGSDDKKKNKKKRGK